MADPAPSAGLPTVEWIELRNTSSYPVQLQGCRVGDRSGWSGAFPAYLLHPDSFLLVCSNTALAVLSGYGNAIPVSAFPSLDNDGDLLALLAADGTTLHAIQYDLTWYGNALKEAGGWTLEISDPHSPCQGSTNWSASVDPSGGTPARQNSIHAVNPDSRPPQPVNTYIADSTNIVLVFDEPVDSLSGATITHYTIDGGLTVTSAETLAPLFNRVRLRTNNSLSAIAVYTLTITQVKDCSGNITGELKVKAALPAAATPGNMVINEILFNPRSNGYDFVELFNNGDRVIDAATLHVANRNSSGVISSIRPCSNYPHYIFPGDYAVLTEKPQMLPLQYLVTDPGCVLEVNLFPSFPDDEGTVVLINAQGEVVDEVKYSDDWHFKLITDAEGVSLERISDDGQSQDPSNWHSAASTAGYGTPGYRNSQHNNTAVIEGVFEVFPKVISPDNDGRDDVISIRYQLPIAGYMTNIIIFDLAGRPVRLLVRNALLGTAGYWKWDGLGENGKKLSTGPYIILAELFNLGGKRKRFKESVVLFSQ